MSIDIKLKGVGEYRDFLDSEPSAGFLRFQTGDGHVFDLPLTEEQLVTFFERSKVFDESAQPPPPGPREGLEEQGAVSRQTIPADDLGEPEDDLGELDDEDDEPEGPIRLRPPGFENNDDPVVPFDGEL